MTMQQMAAGIIYMGTLLGAIIAIVTVVNMFILRPAKTFIRAEIVGALEGIRHELSNLSAKDEETAAALARHIREDHNAS
jgi:hypothetical protein